MSSHPQSKASHEALPLLKAIAFEVAAAPNDLAFAQSLVHQLNKGLLTDAAVFLTTANSNPLAASTNVPEFSRTLNETGMQALDQLSARQRVAATSKPLGEGRNQVFLVPIGSKRNPNRGVIVAITEADALGRIEILQTLGLVAELCSSYFQEASGEGTSDTQRLHESLDIKSASYATVNELRLHFGCDRVSVFLRKRNKSFQLQAVSGQATINRRANVVKAISRLVNAVAKLEEPFQFPGAADLSPQTDRALQHYLEITDADAVCVMPLREPVPASDSQHEVKVGKVFGAVAFESFRGASTSHESIAKSPMLASAEQALFNARSHSQIFLLPLWTGLGRLLGSRPLLKAIVGLLVLAAVVAALVFVETDHYVHADGTLQPKVQRHLFAPSDGVVSEVLTKHGDRVDSDQTLVQLKNAELSQEIERILGELQIARRQLATAAAMRLQKAQRTNEPRNRSTEQLASEQQQLETQIRHLTEQQELLKSRQERLSVTSPFAGEVLTWDLEKRLRSRPINRGQLLVTVADIYGQWEVVLDLPESRISTLLAAQRDSDEPLPVKFVLGTAPRDYWDATLVQVADNAQPHEELGIAVQLKADVPDFHEMERRAGSDVRAKILCGRRSLGYTLFHDLANFVRMRFLFYFGSP